MDKDIMLAFILIVVLLVFYYWSNSTKKESFKQEDNFEPNEAFDNLINKTEGDEKHGEIFHDEQVEKNVQVPTKKAQVVVFLSKHCPHCIQYDKHKFIRLKGKLNKLGKGNVDVKKIYADNDPQGLFNKYDVQYVPMAVVIHNNKNAKVEGEISPVNSLKTIDSLK
jgi:thiol-disulfide isomerase/thioredoxin